MPNYRHSTCPYCPKTFRNAGPFDNHLRSSHPDQTGCFYNGRGGRQESPQSISESQELYLEHNDLSYSSPEDLEENFSSDSEAESRFDDSSDELEDSPETATRRELYKDSGKTYGKVPGVEKSIRNILENPWSPFWSVTEFKLARFFVNANVSWENIETFIVRTLHGHNKKTLKNPVHNHAYYLDRQRAQRDQNNSVRRDPTRNKKYFKQTWI